MSESRPGPESRPRRRARLLNGLPSTPREAPLARRLLTDPWLWITVAMTIVFAACLVSMYLQLHPDKVYEHATSPGINNDAFRLAFHYAWPTAAVWSAAFLLLDRFRPQRIVMWYLAFGWGACVATWAAMYINTWAGELMSVQGAGDPAAGLRPAVFAAPFVEEACKATVLFALALLMRYRIVSLLQGISLAGLAAIGFAFIENIVYYSRAIVYSSMTIQAGDAEESVQRLVVVRGFYTSFGHPLFTTMTAIGLTIGLRTRSKIVRVVAPITGYCVAALGHMAFNGSSSLIQSDRQEQIYYIVGVCVFLPVAGFWVGQVFREGRRVRARLLDYVRMGWLQPRDPIVYSSVLRRAWLLVLAVSKGPRTFLATKRTMRAVSELAYLRDAVTRGIIDQAGLARERLLLDEVRALRTAALTDPVGQRIVLPRFNLRRPAAGVQGWPAPARAIAQPQRR